MEEKIKQAIENIAKNLEVHKEYIRFDNTEQIYIIEDYLDNKIIEIKKDIKFDNLMDYPLKFSYCNFLETVIGWNKTFKEKIIFKEVVFCKVVNFSFSIFDKNINFSNVKFEDKLYFEKCQFKEKFEFFGINNLKVEFNNSLFEKEVYFGKEINDKNIEKSNSFGSCSFEYANFSNCYFKNEVYFKNNEFKQVFFRNSKFNDNVYFNNSVFKDYTDFHECEFEKTACFYGVRFDKAPNFSACYFKEPKAVNLINVDIDKLDFKSLEQYIEDNYKDETCENKQEITEEQRNNNCKLKCAKHLKDSFRVIKDVLITQNNTLEAQEWHKLELYAKEKELEIQLSKNKNDNLKKESKNQVYNPKDYEKFNYSRLKTLKSKLMPLIFYSLLPMAHTLFLPFYLFCTIFIIIKIITKILIKISKLFYYFYISFRPLEWNKFIIFWKVKFNHCIKKLMTFGRKMLDFTLWFDCILLQVYRNTSDHHTNFLKILNFTILMISLYAFMGFLFSKTVDFISYFDQISIAIASYIILLVFALMLVNVKKQLYQYGVILIFMLCGAFTISMILFLSSEYISTFCFLIYFLGVLIFYLFFICKIKLFVFIVRFFAYMIFIATIIIKPQLINPFAGIFSSDKLYESKFEKRLNDLNTSAIINLAKLSQKDFNFTKEYINISFTELNSAKTLIIANKEKLKEILSKVYNDKYVSDYKKVLNELENNTSNVKNIIEEIDNKNNNSVVSAQLNKFLKLNFSQEIDILYAIKSNFSISEKLSPEQMALFDQKDSQDKLKSVLALLKFKLSFEGILKIINQDEITENTIKSTSVLYSIILLLCIFSLQKTARKNSIVPS
ncbi:pentapeptide repeat-containing protein [Campylobacter jejuni]|uniref:Pentapeptide repeat-containing protein n=1 Tax=Campylobacter jejuni TaxID=197 RepID=A0AAX0HRZ4_CAMJU|nr:pentapeptide repeat-containing protein [Campylobacter jejuni]EAJ4553137.1 pentapeptide repeat-containing protein [Campylobacter jejuni]EAJ5416182.1 pentapeptide repeat-containing protein [Campylobacter jejuni]EAK7720771.1 pentapeptide repeat-containing protein [Campylobacter jejuni]EAK7742394.1 pentapeptide repeat-containing protein [Campylobacter jejuni]EAK7785976.1 pentapeptide repeat-containing protein [Campylobacter jejuni]